MGNTYFKQIEDKTHETRLNQEKKHGKLMVYIWKNHGEKIKKVLKQPDKAVQNVYCFQNSLTYKRLLYDSSIKNWCKYVVLRSVSKQSSRDCQCIYHRKQASTDGFARSRFPCWVLKWFFIQRHTYLWGFPAHIVQEYKNKVAKTGSVAKVIAKDASGIPLPPKMDINNKENDFVGSNWAFQHKPFSQELALLSNYFRDGNLQLTSTSEDVCAKTNTHSTIVHHMKPRMINKKKKKKKYVKKKTNKHLDNEVLVK